MHPAVFIYKVKKRLRFVGELYCPKLSLTYTNNSDEINTENIFSNWADSVPFSSDISIKTRLTQQDQKSLISRADAIYRHEFDLLGSGPYSFGEDIDWHLDFKSGFRWSGNLLHSRIQNETGIRAEIKVPWELSRFHHAVTLSLAWKCSGDIKYVKELVHQMEDWIEKNPVGYGVNWSCPMDVAIRAVNWLVASVLLIEPLTQKKFDDFRQNLVSSLWQHAGFIQSHMEWLGPKGDSGANHLLFDLAGLFTLSLFFKDTRKGDNWFRFSHSQLEVQMMRQVFPDGVHFECSLAYHRLCLEAFLWCGVLARRAELPFSSEYYDRLERMQRFVADYMKPSGKASLIGDNDDGCMMNNGFFSLDNHCYLMPQDPSGTFFIDRFLIDGIASVKTEYSSQSVAYPHGGFFFLKNKYAQVAIRAGCLAYKGTHAHNDQISFELSLNGKDIFVDRGTYVYTPDPEARNRYRSTAAHNVMQINGLEQNQLDSPFFGMSDETQTRVIKHTVTSMEAVHYGFRTLRRLDAEYHRFLFLEQNRFTIRDKISALQRGDVLRWFFHLAPGLIARVCGKTINIFYDSSLLCVLNGIIEAEVSIKDFSHSPSYGVIEDAVVVVLQYVVSDKHSMQSFEFNIIWDN